MKRVFHSRFYAIGVWHSDPGMRHWVPVPDELFFRPLCVGIFVGTSEPHHPEVLLRKFVFELIMLDPRDRDDRLFHAKTAKIEDEWRRYRENDFTVNLVWFLADTPASRFCKHTRAWNLASDGGCEACLAVGVKFSAKSATSRYQTTEAGLELREDSKFEEYASHLSTVSDDERIRSNIQMYALC